MIDKVTRQLSSLLHTLLTSLPVIKLLQCSYDQTSDAVIRDITVDSRSWILGGRQRDKVGEFYGIMTFERLGLCSQMMQQVKRGEILRILYTNLQIIIILSI